jgi:DNA polymerase V
MIYVEDLYTAIGKKEIKEAPIENKFIASGWPAASDDYADKTMNLHKLLVKQPSATYFMRIGSQQYVREGIYKNDLLIVDRSLSIAAGRLVIAVVDGVLSVRRVVSHSGQLCLSGVTPQPIGETGSTEASVWGVIAHIVRTLNHEG